MSRILLYSTNVYIKYIIQKEYRGDVHYVWCSAEFDSKVVSPYTLGSHVPPSSNPADIYARLKSDVARQDGHSDKIKEQKTSLKARAIEWHNNGTVTEAVRDEIVYMVDNASFKDWRPLIYVIPRQAVESRMKTVPPEKRAGFGPEYIVPDLAGSEFDFLELP